MCARKSVAKKESFTKMTVDEARDRLRAAGLRCTACRIAVLRHLAGRSNPVSHAEVAEPLAADGFDNSTIYRSLVEFSEGGLTARLDVGDHVWRFELLSPDQEITDHAHFMCVDCGQVTCADDVSVRVTGKSKSDLGQVTEVLLKGRCPTCQ